MEVLIFFTILALAKTEITSNYECVRNIKYEEEILKKNINSPYQMVIDHDTNTLFFSYTARRDEYFKIAYLSLKTKDFGLVSGIREGFANAVDNLSHIVYMGGEDGVYTFNYETKTATHTGIPKNKPNIWQMFYSDGLYFCTYPDEKAFLYKDGVVVEVPEIKPYRALVMTATKAGNIYYANSTGLFQYNKGSGQTIQKHEVIANGFSSDLDGNIYFSAPDGIYYINEKEEKTEKLLDINQCYGVAIEGNGDIIYSLTDRIIRLKRTREDCIIELEEHKY